MHFSASIKGPTPVTLVNLKGGIFRIIRMKRPFEPIPETGTDAAENGTKREFPKRKIAMILGYSGTGYQGMQR